jgi:molecular chaperone GrpE (heat shock protein)
MTKMYKPDPNQPKPALATHNNDHKVEELEAKLRQLTEQFNKLQAEFDRLSKNVRRQGSDFNTLSSRINRVK